MDEFKHIVRKGFGQIDGKKDDRIKDVPMLANLQAIFAYVSEHYFEPPLGALEAYAYPGKHGHGEPILLSLDTTIAQIRRQQKQRHVPDHRLTLIAKADMSELHL